LPTIDYEDPMTFGKGMQSLQLKARGDGVTGDEPTSVGGGAQTVRFSLFKIDAYDQYQRAFGFDADAAMTYGLFHASAKFSFAEQHQYNSFSKYLVASIFVTNEFKQLRNPRLTDAASGVFASSADRFYEQFGDSFILGITTGGAYYAVLEFKSENSTDLHNISAALEVGEFGLFSGHAEFSSAVQRFAGQTSLHITSFQLGGADTKQSVNVDDIVAKAANFAPDVREVAIPVSAFLQDYKTLTLPQGPNLIDIENAKLVLQNYAPLRNTLVQKLNEIEYIQTHPEQFVNPEQFDLAGMQSQVSEALRVITQNASRCANNVKDCQFPDVTIPTLTLPERKPGVVPPPTAPKVAVPDLLRFGHPMVKIAHALLANAGLQHEDQGPLSTDQGAGHVVAQNPVAGTMVDIGSVVVLQIGDYHPDVVTSLGHVHQ
jgi:hypothetical protein